MIAVEQREKPMTVRRIIPWPHAWPAGSPPRQVTEINDEIRTLWDDIDRHDGMRCPASLAAPSDRGAVTGGCVDASKGRGQADQIGETKLLDSMASETHEMNTMQASPNLPGISAKVRRPRGVKRCSILRRQGDTVGPADFVGLEATALQHQIDHLAR